MKALIENEVLWLIGEQVVATFSPHEYMIESAQLIKRKITHRLFMMVCNRR